jgi:type I restriction enzyme, S subunit
MNHAGKRRLPEGWRWVRLEEVCNLINGNAYKLPDWSDAGLPIIRIQNLNDDSKPFNYWAGSLTGRVTVQEGDVLLAWSGTPGTSFGVHCWKKGKAVLNQHIFRVDFKTVNIAPEWFVLAVNHQLDVLIGKAHGGVGLRHVKKKEVESLQIPLPSLAEQERIAGILNYQKATLE